MVYSFKQKPTLNMKKLLSQPPKLAQFIPKGERFICATSRPSWVWDRALNPSKAIQSLGANMNLFFGLNEVGGYILPVLSKEDYQLSNLILADIPVQGSWHFRKITNPNQLIRMINLWRLYSIQYLITDLEVNHPELSLVTRDEEYQLYKIKDSLPRLFFSSRIQVVNNWDLLLQKLNDINSIGSTTYIVANQGIVEDMEMTKGIITSILRRSPTDLSIDVQVNHNKSLLIMSDRWTKEWQATIDGKPTTVYKVNGIQRGVLIHAGNHTVRFYYYDRKLLIGLWLAGSALFVILSILIWLILLNYG